MRITNGVYRPLSVVWDSVELPLKAGTPMSIAGVVANGGTACGIVPQTVSSIPATGRISILIAGEVDLAEVEAAYGASLEKAALEAMSGIKFFGEDGTPVPDPVWSIPDMPTATASVLGGVKIGSNINVTEAGVISVKDAAEGTKGVVKMAANVSEAAGSAPTAAEFKALLDALIEAGIMAAPAPAGE